MARKHKLKVILKERDADQLMTTPRRATTRALQKVVAKGRVSADKGKTKPKPARTEKVLDAEKHLPSASRPMCLGMISGANRFINDLSSTHVVSDLSWNLFWL